MNETKNAATTGTQGIGRVDATAIDWFMLWCAFMVFLLLQVMIIVKYTKRKF